MVVFERYVLEPENNVAVVYGKREMEPASYRFPPLFGRGNTTKQTFPKPYSPLLFWAGEKTRRTVTVSKAAFARIRTGRI